MKYVILDIRFSQILVHMLLKEVFKLIFDKFLDPLEFAHFQIYQAKHMSIENPGFQLFRFWVLYFLESEILG